MATASTKHKSTIIKATQWMEMVGYLAADRSSGGRNKRNEYSFDWSYWETVVPGDRLACSQEPQTVVASDGNGRPQRPETVVPGDTHITLELNTGRASPPPDVFSPPPNEPPPCQADRPQGHPRKKTTAELYAERKAREAEAKAKRDAEWETHFKRDRQKAKGDS